ncbi:lipase family alpha/beta hydrolase, partial [Sciscionella sediminilitoris]|uniref:lipase family alpha/beta hydrolase n=1 Tax=Sciscionella sediminilitoris TaxID=1445613 RepID=UPI0004DF7C0F
GFESELPGPLSQIGGTSRMEVSAARDLAPFVDKVRASTGARKVDLVGHSEGTAMPRYYLNYLGGAAKVDKSVNLAPLWQGSKFYGVDVLYQLAREAGAKPLVRGIFDHIYPAGPQLLTGSDYINKVNTGEAFPHEVTYTSIVTKYDEAVAPYTNGLAPALPNTRNIVVQDQCPADLSEHGLLATDPVAAQDILNALDPRHAEPVDCQATPRNSS